MNYALIQRFFLPSNELSSGCWWCFFELPPPPNQIVVGAYYQITQTKSVGEPELETTISCKTQVQHLLHQTTSSAPEALAPTPVSLELLRRCEYSLDQILVLLGGANIKYQPTSQETTAPLLHLLQFFYCLISCSNSTCISQEAWTRHRHQHLLQVVHFSRAAECFHMGGGFALIEVGLACISENSRDECNKLTYFHQIWNQVIIDKCDDDYMIFAHTSVPFYSCSVVSNFRRFTKANFWPHV